MKQARRINADGRDGQPRPTLFNHSLPVDELHPLRAILQPLAQHIQQSLHLAHYWDWFTQSENITSWRTVSLHDLYDFAEAMANIYLEYQDTATFTDAGYWAVPTPWADSWMHTFRLQDIVGLPASARTAHRFVCTVPSERLIGGIAHGDWIFASPAPCRAVWIVQPPHTKTLVHTLRARVHSPRDLHTNVIVICPDTHPVHLELCNWWHECPTECSIALTGSAPAIPFLWRQGPSAQVREKLGFTMYWITGRKGDQSVTLNDVISHTGALGKHNDHLLHSLPKHKCRHTTRASARDHFWRTLQTLVNSAREIGTHWTEQHWVKHLDQLNTLLRESPQPWVRRLWAYADKCEQAAHTVGELGMLIYAVWSVKTRRVYIGETGAIKSLKKSGHTIPTAQKGCQILADPLRT